MYTGVHVVVSAELRVVRFGRPRDLTPGILKTCFCREVLDLVLSPRDTGLYLYLWQAFLRVQHPPPPPDLVNHYHSGSQVGLGQVKPCILSRKRLSRESQLCCMHHIGVVFAAGVLLAFNACSCCCPLLRVSVVTLIGYPGSSKTKEASPVPSGLQ